MIRNRDSWRAIRRKAVAVFAERKTRRVGVSPRSAFCARSWPSGRLACESLEDRLALTATSLELSEVAIPAESAVVISPETSAVNLSAVASPATASQSPGRVAMISQNAVADFSRSDVNTTSTTFNQAVSPRDYLQQVSAWYFGHAT